MDSRNVPSYDQDSNLVTPCLTRDQEHVIMVSALRQVMISNSGGRDITTSSTCESRLPPLDAGPCPLCVITGCYGCVFPRHGDHIVKKDQKKYKGVRQKPSGTWSAEIWDPSLKVRRWLGTFPTAEMAAHAYNDAAAGLVGSKGKRKYASTKKTTVEDY
ncbi:hypothetical protein CARUB_v10015379mg [Capsella rubella]|uniref:AP2/ERF domain-containing protein n=1 Tax=Capsella rubella TaxID=81985 RepID=R0I6R7_9BRAS|nr:ethylene-responsive transcription factor ERF120 [Capsella rubella]EOA32128.1 hypothetical protein CARUB_v10015379mg [Capsella rubella]